MQASTLCIYAAHARNEEYAENVRHFVQCGGIVPDVDYVIVVNDGGLPLDFGQTLPPNVRVTHRPNEGYDFGAWSHALQELGGCQALAKRYQHFVFVNSSVRGPCIAGLQSPNWTLALTRLLQGRVALAGITINVLPLHTFRGATELAASYGLVGWRVLPHVQSMVFAVGADTLLFLANDGIFDSVPPVATLGDIIVGRELRMSATLLAAGYNITCLARRYTGIDYASGIMQQDPNPTSRNGDPFFPGAYWGLSLDPHEVLFYKTARMGVLQCYTDRASVRERVAEGQWRKSYGACSGVVPPAKEAPT